MDPCFICGHPGVAHHEDGCHVAGCRCGGHEPIEMPARPDTCAEAWAVGRRDSVTGDWMVWETTHSMTTDPLTKVEAYLHAANMNQFYPDTYCVLRYTRDDG